jgi:hypothetical protein
VSRPIRNSILGRRRREGQEVTLAEPRKTAPFMYLSPTVEPAGAGKLARAPLAYPDRPMPKGGPARDRWVRELVGSIIDRTAPVLLSRDEAILALDLSPGAFDRRIGDGRLALESAVVVGDHELYRREQVREILLAAAEAAA